MKENSIKELTLEQKRAEEYQAHLEEVKSALAEEIEVLKPLALSIEEQAEYPVQEFEAANSAIRKLHGWLQDNESLAKLAIKDYKNVRVFITPASGQKAGAGLPELDIPILIFPDIAWWNKDNPRDVVRQIWGSFENIQPAALFYRPEDFLNSDKNETNPFGVTGIIVTHESAKDSSAVHEAAHFLDFYSPLRKGVDQIISEIIAFRQQGVVYHEEIGKLEWAKRLSDHLVDYLLLYGINNTIEMQELEQRIDDVIDIIKRLDKVLGDSSAVTHILLNSLTLADIEQWEGVSDEDLIAMKKNNYEKS